MTITHKKVSRMPARRADDYFAALADHERRDEERHAEIMRYVGASEEFQKTSTRNTEVMFQGIADLTQLIGKTRETVAKDDGSSHANRRWVSALIAIMVPVACVVLTVALMLLFHVH